MWYFAYDDLVNWRQMLRTYSSFPPRVGLPTERIPAVLRNYRVCFPQFSEQWHGGVASVVNEPGESVAGVLLQLPLRAIELLNHRADQLQRELVYVSATPLGSDDPIRATAHRLSADEAASYPPSSRYLSLMISAACDARHSPLWIKHLSGFAERDVAAHRRRPARLVSA